MRIDWKILFLAVWASALSAQDSHPSCNKCSGTYITSDEVQAYLKRSPADAVVTDQQVRAVDVGKSHVDIGVVYRNSKASGAVAEHDLVSEVYHVIDGSATLVLGSDIVDLKRRPADDRAVKMLNGPGGNGVSIRNGVTYQLKPGDVVIIPAGVGHWFTKIDDHISYLMVRIDPDKVTPLKDEAASKADLSAGLGAR
ncbi:MAG TPA: AraC family ligand binding domain-containing protein [Bryobacteraceae bacterium]|jgi:mannose-6-phosphate isomerase-like protein (cupin superfamily)|nr:AraC family ligand binding domain-containing protein [Bryobacteraceae bacterium]